MFKAVPTIRGVCILSLRARGLGSVCVTFRAQEWGPGRHGFLMTPEVGAGGRCESLWVPTLLRTGQPADMQSCPLGASPRVDRIRIQDPRHLLGMSCPLCKLPMGPETAASILFNLFLQETDRSHDLQAVSPRRMETKRGCFCISHGARGPAEGHGGVQAGDAHAGVMRC